MNTCDQLIDFILDDIKSLMEDPIGPRDFASEARPIPPSTPLEGGFIFISPTMDGHLTLLAEALLKSDFMQYKHSFTKFEWNKVIRRALSPVISNYDTEAPPLANAVLTGVQDRIRNEIARIPICTYAFGCHLFRDSDSMRPITIGPVQFETKDSWLAGLRSNGVISKTSRSRLKRMWKGEGLRKRRPSNDSFRESDIQNSVGECAFVCSVEVVSKGSEMGLYKAASGARLALTAIALAWESPSYALRSMNLIYNRHPHDRNYFVSTQSGLAGGGSSASYLPGGLPGITAEEWYKIESPMRGMLDCVGRGHPVCNRQ